MNRKGIDMSNINTIIKNAGTNDSLFGDFCQGRMQGVYQINNKNVFFKSDEIFNPLRELATVLVTDCESIEMPILSSMNGWADKTCDEFSKTDAINIKLYPLYSKFKMNVNSFRKISDLSDYVKNQLFLQLVDLEKNAFLNGDGVNNPLGLIPIFRDNDKNLKVIKKSSIFMDMLDFIHRLSSIYQNNATFVISSKTYYLLNQLSQDHSKLTLNGIAKLFDKNIVLMDEIGDKILFGDFKQAVVIAENECDTIHCHSSNIPNYVEISLPNSVGIGVINKNALICAEFKEYE